MTRVLLLWAAPSSPNLGVRALAAGTAALVRKVNPEAEILSQNYGHGEASVNIGVGRSLAREFLMDSRGLKSWVKEFDVVMDTRAGDSFADIYGLPRLRQMCQMAEFVRACGVPLVLGPQTIGPFTTRLGKMIGSASLRRASMVMARDTDSAWAAERLGRAPDVVTTDVVFAMDQPVEGEPRDILLNVSGLLWTSDSHGPAQRYRESIRALIRGLQKRGREVSLLSHVLDSANSDNDEPSGRELQAEFGLEHLVPEDLTHLRSLVKGSKLVIGSRMHACLNALSVGTPAIAVAYSRKFKPLLTDLGWEHVIDLRESSHAGDEVLAMIDSGHELSSQVVTVRRRAEEHLDGAVDALQGLLR